MGRIHPVKGLMDLISAWSRVKPVGWHVVIAGGCVDGYLAELKEESRKLKVEDDFEFVGRVEAEAKWEMYRSADLFVLPSHSENFGIVVAEALACGVPVIATRGTPWDDLVTHRCGWWTEVGSQRLAVALCEATNCDDATRHEMGLRGRKLVESKYSWANAAEQMLAVYRWMLRQSEQPASVQRLSS